jgi:hypothetical protein
MWRAISADLAFSITLANSPIQLKISFGVTRTYASPELTDEAAGLTRRVWQILRPLT